MEIEMPKFSLELSFQGRYSGSEAEDYIKDFPSKKGDPYEAQLVRDTVGRWFLRVFTTDAEAAKLKVCVKIEKEVPEMNFVAAGPAMFFAEMRLSESMATALNSGHRPIFLTKE
jgi:hypothetical protein